MRRKPAPERPARIVKATIAYHGAAFSGWQIQRQGERTVQGVLEAALKKTIGRVPKLVAASRTDAGVHALGQVVQFALESETPAALSDPNGRSARRPLTAQRLREALNFHLPADAAVLKVQFIPASQKFHARHSPKAKHYRYRIHASRTKPVFDTDTCIWVHPDLDTDKMREAARFLVGKHDFTAFSARTETAQERRRTIRIFSIKRSGARLTIDIVGDGFLQHMIRIMVGTLIEIGKGTRPVSDVARLLKSGNRLEAGRTAAPHGLTLVKVYY